jgi:hypothetical protein
VNKIAIALLLGAVCAVGCGDKTNADGSASAKASGKATGSAAGPAVSKVCEEYWARVRKCNEFALKSMPDGDAKTQAKKAQDDSEKTTREAWKQMEGAALDSACKAGLDGMAQAKCE